MSSPRHRLRKYKRKKDAAVGTDRWEWLARLYWRYWHKVHGGHQSLWR